MPFAFQFAKQKAKMAATFILAIMMRCNFIQKFVPFCVALFLGVLLTIVFTSTGERKSKAVATKAPIIKQAKLIEQSVSGISGGAKPISCSQVLCAKNGKVPHAHSDEQYDKLQNARGIRDCENGKNVKLRILKRPNAEYTTEALESKLNGTVRVRVTFSASNQVTNVQPITTLPFGLTEQAITTARQIEFEPEIKCGVPISISRLIEYKFSY